VEKRSERSPDKAQQAEKAECMLVYMSILRPFATPYWQAQ
jgi:hypothetical protein